MRRHLPLQPFAGIALEVYPRKRSTQGPQSLYTRPIMMCGLALTVGGVSSTIVFLYPNRLSGTSSCILAASWRTWTCHPHVDCLKARQCPFATGDDYVVGVHLCHRFLLLRPGEGASANLKRAPPPFPLCLLLRWSLDPVLSIVSPSLAMSPKAMCPNAAMERLPTSRT